jgi:hypothetical protein
MWVFTYKFDEDGYLLKYKARLVVRGDLQEQYGDTYAATLAARLFRAEGHSIRCTKRFSQRYSRPYAHYENARQLPG